MEKLLKLLTRSTASAVLLVSLLCGFAGSAQVVRTRVYGTATGTEELGTMIPLPAGGYFMAGARYTPPRTGVVATGRLYVLRLGANGDTVWTKKLPIPGCFGFYPLAATADASGRVLVSGQSFTFAGTSQGDAFLVMLNPQGDTLWTKRTQGIGDDGYYASHLLPGGDFIVTATLNNSPTLTRLTATGQIVWQRNLSYAPGDVGSVGTIMPVAGTAGSYWVRLFSGNSPYPSKYVRYDAAGIDNMNTPAPPGFAFIADQAPLGQQYLVVIANEVRRLDANLNTLWTQSPTARGLSPSFKKIVPTLDGNYLVGGEAYVQSGIDITLNKISPAGLNLADTVFSSFSNVFLKGLAIEPASGDYVFAGYAQNGPIGGSDAFWTQWRRSLVTGTRNAAPAPGLAWSAYPNPLPDNTTVTLQAEQPLRGTLHLRDALGRHLGTWPAAGQRTQALELPPALPAGVYLLTLENPTAAPRTLRLVKP